jgi:serine/threonine protein kinase/tetratricopeptide (TPR) repeat protein
VQCLPFVGLVRRAGSARGSLRPDNRRRGRISGDIKESAGGLEDTLGLGASTLGTPPETEARRIGPYRLLQLVGEGGMGEVWLAEQLEPVRRKVAIKLIKAGMDSRQVVARFESERQALAVMNHPAIAKVFDAGATSEGRPYFVMEYVAGVPITEHCDAHQLSTPARLALLAEVCQGVQHAHQKAIIHRDLKPSNILVSLVDGKAVPKIIDFGIAKATAYRLTEKTLHTDVGSIIGTPEYMSPEQADLTSQDVDTRTDVYSLGVILYQLLTGELPFASKDLRSSSYEELRRKLREEEPPRPSTRVGTLEDGASEAARKRNTSASELKHALVGDLDAITLRAMEKERSRRYATPLEFSADIERHLRDEPVLARLPTRAYRLRKYVRRHRAGVSVTTGLALLLLAFSVVMTLQTRRVGRERDRASREAEKSQRVTDFMTGMFKPSPAVQRNSVGARAILDNAAKDIGTLSKDPELQAQLMGTMATAYSNLGLLPQAEALRAQVVETLRRTFGAENPATLRAQSALALAKAKNGSDHTQLLRDTLEAQRRVLGIENADTLQSMSLLGWDVFHEGRFAEAEKMHRETLEGRRRVLGAEYDQTLWSAMSLAMAIARQGRLSEAETLMAETVATEKRVLGPGHPETVRATGMLADLLEKRERFAEAETVRRDNLASARTALGAENPQTLTAMQDLADSLVHDGRLAEAEQMRREVLETNRNIFGPDSQGVAESAHGLAKTLQSEGRYSEAEAFERQALEIMRRTPPVDPAWTLFAMERLARILVEERRLAEAETLVREEVEALRRLPDRAERLAFAQSVLASILAQEGKPKEALAFLEEALAHGLDAKTALRLSEDQAFRSLHGDVRFEALVAEAKKRGEVAAQGSR